MNRETLRELEKSNNLKFSATAALALNTNISFEEAERMLNAMFEECKHPTGLQRGYEATFNC